MEEKREGSIDELCVSFLLHRRRNKMESSERGGSHQFRRANIVYFLSRNGSLEHPHLIRVHHLHKHTAFTFVRWLSELREKDMPDSFAWSYKRRYRSGYVWQDLMDDDLITPISDNEYVLKGSFLHFHSLSGFSCDEKEDTLKKEAKKPVEEFQVVPDSKLKPEPEPETLNVKLDDDSTPKLPPQLDHDSSVESDKHVHASDQKMAVWKIKASTRREKEEHNFQRSCSGRASFVFRNILTCGAADTNDSVLLLIGRARGSGPHQRRSSTSDVPRQQKQQQSYGTENPRKSGKKRVGSTNYKALGLPNCSQCKKPFDPEKLQSHMQSCKALTGRGCRNSVKGRNSNVDRVPLKSKTYREEEEISGYLT